MPDWTVDGETTGAGWEARVAALCAKVAELEDENNRLLGRVCLICGASQPCELNDDPDHSPCTFDPSPVDAAKSFLKRAESAEAKLRAVVEAAAAFRAASTEEVALFQIAATEAAKPPHEWRVKLAAYSAALSNLIQVIDRTLAGEGRG